MEQKIRGDRTSADACTRQAVVNHETVASANAQQHEMRQLKTHLKAAEKWGRRWTLINAALTGLYFFLTFVSMAAIFWLSFFIYFTPRCSKLNSQGGETEQVGVNQLILFFLYNSNSKS